MPGYCFFLLHVLTKHSLDLALLTEVFSKHAQPLRIVKLVLDRTPAIGYNP